jgi:UDP-N-acetylglucosamine 2-epimerase
MHPSCGKAYYEMAERSATRYGVRTVLTKDNLRELLALAQVVAIPSSTIGYEAVLLSKPLVCVDFESQGDDSVFVRANVAISVEKANELVQGIEAAINLAKTREYEISRGLFIENHLDGNNASSRIADLINELYNKSKMDKGMVEK